MEYNLNLFSERLRALRKEKKLKQKDMAELLQCAERNYQRLEYGKTNVTATTLMFLCDYFNVSADYILGRTDCMEPLQTMAARIRSLREQNGLTQKNMAEILGCTPSNYQKIEYGKINIPTTTLAFLADYFNVSADYLLGRTDEI